MCNYIRILLFFHFRLRNRILGLLPKQLGIVGKINFTNLFCSSLLKGAIVKDALFAVKYDLY